MQLVQNAAGRLLPRVDYSDYIILLLKELYWLPVCFTTQFKVLILTFKALKRLEPGNRKDCLLLHKLPGHSDQLKVASPCNPYQWYAG